MIELTPQQRRALRAKAHHLHPVVSIGQHGLTPRVLNEIDIALTAHGLVKIRVHSDDRPAREAMLAAIGTQLHAAPVQHLGKLLIVWRERDEDDAAAAPVAKSRPRTPAPSRHPHAERTPSPAEGRDVRPAATTRRRRSSAVPVAAPVAASPGSASRRASGAPRGAGYLTRGDAQAGRPPRKATTSTRPPRKLSGTAVTTKDEAAAPRERKPAARRSATKATPGARKGKAATRRRGD